MTKRPTPRPPEGGKKPPLPFPKCDPSASILSNKIFFDSKLKATPGAINEVSDRRKEL